MCACEQKTETNPFFAEFQTEYGAPDFTKIKLEHYEPAFLKGIEEQNVEIKAIVDNPEKPIVIGFALTSGGASADPTQFNPEIFSTRRIVIGPNIAFLGFIFMGVGIMWPCKKK